MYEVRVQAGPDELEDLRLFLLQEMGSEIDLQEIASTGAGELREPVLVSLIIALGGPVVVTGFVTVLKRWMDHQEKMKELENRADAAKRKHELIKFQLLQEASAKDISLNDLLVLAKESQA